MRRRINCQYPPGAQATIIPSPNAVNDEQDDRHSPCGPVSDLTAPLDLLLHSSASVDTPATISISSSGTVGAPSTVADTFGLNDLGLLHHWTVCTSLGIFRAPSLKHLWQTVFPQIGLQYPFVMHAIMALAALHIAHKDSSKRGASITKAANHHNQGLQGFQNAVKCISKENSEALFVWSTLNVLYVFAISNPLHNVESHASSHSPSDLLLGVEWIPMMRGIAAVVRPAHDHLRLGKLNVFLSLGNWFELNPDRECSDLVDSYFFKTRETWKSSNHGDVYEEVLHLLRKYRLYSQQFRSMDSQALEQWGYNGSWSALLMILHFAPESYFTLLHQRQPPALVLFSFFGALLYELNDYWFFEGWGKAIVEVIDHLLGSYWRPWILWPLQIVEA